MDKTKIFIADDHPIVREGLKTLLERSSKFTVVGEASDGLSAVKLIKTTAPDVAILDIGMPGLNGIEVTRKVVADKTHTRVVILSMHSNRQFLLESFKAGAQGFILKECAFEELIQAIQTVMKDKLFLGSRMTDRVIKDYISSVESTKASAFTLLSSKEREVLQMLAEGCNTKAIAAQLNVSVKTIESRRVQLMEKLNLRSVAELTKYAIREGLTSV